MHLGLALVHVEPRGEDPAVFEGRGERLLVDDRSACGVHDDRVRTEQAKPAVVDQVPCRVRERHVERDDVALPEEVVDVGAPARRSGVVTRVVEHLHAEAGRPSCDGLADAAVPDHAERRAVDVAAEVLVDPPAEPSPAAQVGLGLRREA